MKAVIDWVLGLWSVSPFYRGVLCTFVLVILALIFLVILELLWRWSFGRHRCSHVVVPQKSGDIIIDAGAVTDAARSALRRFPQLDIRKVILFCKNGTYSMEIRGIFRVSKGCGGVPKLCQEAEPLLSAMLKELFGVEKFSGMTLRVTEVENNDGSDLLAEFSAPDGSDGK